MHLPVGKIDQGMNMFGIKEIDPHVNAFLEGIICQKSGSLSGRGFS